MAFAPLDHQLGTIEVSIIPPIDPGIRVGDREGVLALLDIELVDAPEVSRVVLGVPRRDIGYLAEVVLAVVPLGVEVDGVVPRRAAVNSTRAHERRPELGLSVVDTPLTPHEYVCKICTEEPRRFKFDPTHLTSGLYIR